MSRLLWKHDTEGHPGVYTAAGARHKHPTDIWKEWVTILTPSGKLCSYRGYPYKRDEWKMKGKKPPRPDHALHLSLSLMCVHLHPGHDLSIVLEVQLSGSGKHGPLHPHHLPSRHLQHHGSERTFIIRAPTHELTTAWFRALRLWDPSGMVTSSPTAYPHPSHLGILEAPVTFASGEQEDGVREEEEEEERLSSLSPRLAPGPLTTSPQIRSGGSVDPQRSVVDVRIPELGGIRVRICLEGVGASALLLREVALIRAQEAASNSAWAWWSKREVWLGWRKGGRFEWCRPQEWINTEEGRYGRGYRLEMRSAPHTGCGGVRVRDPGLAHFIDSGNYTFNIQDEQVSRPRMEVNEDGEEREGGTWMLSEPPWIEGILESVSEVKEEGRRRERREGGGNPMPMQPPSWRPIKYRFGKSIRRAQRNSVSRPGQERLPRERRNKGKKGEKEGKRGSKMKRPRRMWYGTRDGLLLWAPISRVDFQGRDVRCDEEHRAILEPGRPDQPLSLIQEAIGALDLTHVDRVALVGPRTLEVEASRRVRRFRAWDEAGAKDWVEGLSKAIRYWRAQARAKQEALEAATLGILGGPWFHEQLWPVCSLLGCRPILTSGIMYAPSGRGMCGGGAGGKELGGGEGEPYPPGVTRSKGKSGSRVRFERFHGLLLSNGSLQLFRPARSGGPAFLRRGRHISMHGTYILSRPHLPGEERAAARAVTRYYGDGVVSAAGADIEGTWGVWAPRWRRVRRILGGQRKGGLIPPWRWKSSCSPGNDKVLPEGQTARRRKRTVWKRRWGERGSLEPLRCLSPQEMLMWTTMAQSVVERQVRGVIQAIHPGDWGSGDAWNGGRSGEPAREEEEEGSEEDLWDAGYYRV